MVTIVNRLAVLKLACCILLFAAAAQADSVTLTLNPNYPGGYIAYNYAGVDGQNYLEYAAPYLATLTGGTFNDTPAFAICFDIHNDTNVGTAFTGHFENITTTPYLEASFLTDLLNSSGGLAAPLATQGAISLAIWQIMFPSSTDSNKQQFPSGAYDPAAQKYVALAASMVASNQWTAADASVYPTWMPDNPDIQRFGIFFPGTPPVITPEPGGVVLLGSGLLGLALLWRRRARPVRKPGE